MKVLIDTNVIIDVLQQREPWFPDGQKIFIAAAEKRMDGYITTKQVADIHYFSKKNFKGQENADQKARQVISKLFDLFCIADTLCEDCQNAIAVNNGDYEDAIMISTALRINAGCIVTRNTEHFKIFNLKVFTPSEFINFIENTEH